MQIGSTAAVYAVYEILFQALYDIVLAFGGPN
jgi:hypothetical protein